MITALPAEIKSLTQLLKLNLAHNRITNLPPEITDCRTLVELSLDHNELGDLPQNITRLTQLKSITINDNANSLIPTIARNEKLATWLLAPLTREFLLTINQMNPGCRSHLEQLPLEIQEKVLLSLAFGDALFKDCEAIANLSQANKHFNALLRAADRYSCAIADHLAKRYRVSKLVIGLCLKSTNKSQRNKLFQDKKNYDLYVMTQDVRRELAMYTTAKGLAIGTFILRKIDYNNKISQYKVANGNKREQIE